MKGAVHLSWLLAATALAPSARADQDVAKVLSPYYVSLNEAIKRSDGQAIGRWIKTHCTPDFRFVSADRASAGRDAFADRVTGQAAATEQVIDSTYRIKAASVRNNAASLTVSNRFSGVVGLTNPPAKLVYDSLTTDLWVHHQGTWKLKGVVEVKIDARYDGKRLRLTKHGPRIDSIGSE